jgi:hypothetical protein
MAISVKTKVAGFLRGLLRRGEPTVRVEPVAATPAPTPISTPASSGPVPSPTVVAPPRPGNADEIEIPLAAVVASLPMDLRAKLAATKPADASIRLSAEKVISQLALGSVKIPFGELRRLAPGVFVNSGGELDGRLVNLPLNEILPRLNPVLLARRSAKKVEVSAEITGPFADRGRGFTFTTQPLKAPPAPPTAEPAAAPAKPISFAAPVAPRATTPTAAPLQIPPRSITPAISTTSSTHNGGNATTQPPPASTLPPPPPRAVTPLTNGGNGNGNGNGNGHAGSSGPESGGSYQPVPHAPDHGLWRGEDFMI